MATTFGEVSWNDDAFGGDSDKRQAAKDVWLRLKDGSNELRLVTKPNQYLVHKFKKDENDKKDFGQKINCSKVNGSCPLCAAGDKPKPRWFLGVISRDTKTYKILDVSYAVFSQIRKLARSARWGDPEKYDIDIVVDKQGGATGYYSVQPVGKEPLSAEDQIIKDNVDEDDLKRRVTPPTPEAVQKRIDKILGLTPAPSTTPTVVTKGAVVVEKAPEQKVTPAVTMDDEEDDFPSYDAN